ncbi:hypothetical protein B296_00010565 [Ensete ventricosum]|uniref:Uncharacterized protein n=1 Tax=Ensete ventricosum TaxID=4639 RepID=A0A426Z6D2_ENSVE|nr:hypothetical protein B296_00010565 [Ensete ventricosum]
MKVGVACGGKGGHMYVVCMKRWLAMARPPTRLAGHGLATYKGWLTATRPPTRDGHPRAWAATTSPTASRGGNAGRRGGRPLAGWLPVTKGSCLLCRGNGSGDAVRVKEG